MGWCHTAATKLMHKYLQKEAVGRFRPTQKCNQTNATRNEHKIHDIHNIYLNDLTLRLTRSANVRSIFWKSISISCWIHWHSFNWRVSVSFSIRNYLDSFQPTIHTHMNSTDKYIAISSICIRHTFYLFSFAWRPWTSQHRKSETESHQKTQCWRELIRWHIWLFGFWGALDAYIIASATAAAFSHANIYISLCQAMEIKTTLRMILILRYIGYRTSNSRTLILRSRNYRYFCSRLLLQTIEITMSKVNEFISIEFCIEPGSIASNVKWRRMFRSNRSVVECWRLIWICCFSAKRCDDVWTGYVLNFKWYIRIVRAFLWLRLQNINTWYTHFVYDTYLRHIIHRGVARSRSRLWANTAMSPFVFPTIFITQPYISSLFLALRSCRLLLYFVCCLHYFAVEGAGIRFRWIRSSIFIVFVSICFCNKQLITELVVVCRVFNELISEPLPILYSYCGNFRCFFTGLSKYLFIAASFAASKIMSTLTCWVMRLMRNSLLFATHDKKGD